MVIREGALGLLHLADDDRAGRLQATHDLGVGFGHATGVHRRAHGVWRTRKIDQILDRDGHTVQRPERFPRRTTRIAGASLCKRLFLPKHLESPKVLIRGSDSLENELRQGLGTDASGCKQPSDFDQIGTKKAIGIRVER